MWKRLGQVKNKRQVKSILLVSIIIAASMIVVFPLTLPKAKAQVIHLATASQEDAAGLPYDTSPVNDGIVVWDPNDDHIINDPMGYTIESFMTLDIPPMNYVHGDPTDPDEHEITLSGGLSIDVFGKLITNQDLELSPTKTAFLSGGFADWDGIYFHSGSEGRIFDVRIIDSTNGIMFLPGSKLISPGIKDVIFEDIETYGLYMDGVSGYTNMAIVCFDDIALPSGIGLYVANGSFNVSGEPIYFYSHGSGKPCLHISNADIYVNKAIFNGYNLPGNCIYIEGDSNDTVLSQCVFKGGNTTVKDNYYIRCDGCSILVDNCSFRTSEGARSVIANNDAFGIPAHPIVLNASGVSGLFDNNTIGATGSSSVTLQWYMDVFVRDPNGHLIDNAPVWVEDRIKNPAQPPVKITDEHGWARWFITTELIKYESSIINFNPFNVSALNNSVFGYSFPGPVMDISKEVNVTVPFSLIPNTLPYISSISTPNGVQWKDVTIQYMISDSNTGDDGNLSVAVFYSTDGSIWWPATQVGGDITNKLSVDTLYTFIWDSSGPNDLKGIYSKTVYLKVVPYDRAGKGIAGITGNFTVDNKGPEIISGPLVTPTNTTALIEWTFDEPANASVGYGLYVDGRLSDITDEKTGNTMSSLQAVQLTGLQPGRNYTFVINSTDILGNKGSSPLYSFETEIHIQLYKGWNMISIPPITPDPNLGIQPTVSNVLASIAGQYDAVQAYSASDPFGDPWKHYRPGKPYGNDLTLINEIMGLWIHMKNDAVLMLNHKDPTTNSFFNGTLVTLEPGWNFVSYPSLTTCHVGGALEGVPYDMIQTYDAVKGRWLSYESSSGKVLGNVVWEMKGLDGPFDAERLANGNTLIADTGNKRVIEVDGGGNIIWEYGGLDDPIDVERLANGNTLIAEFGSIITPGGIIEIDNANNIVWQYTDPYSPMDVERLANGNTLIAEVGTFSSSGRVIEVDSAGNIVWEYMGIDYPFDAERLANGNTLITDSGNNRIIEVDSARNIIWEYGGLDDPIEVERLANGNTLIVELNRVIEVNSADNIIYEMLGLVDCIDAERLPNGNMLITEISKNRVFEIDNSGVLTQMELGKGYWIHCTAFHLWEVDYV